MLQTVYQAAAWRYQGWAVLSKVCEQDLLVLAEDEAMSYSSQGLRKHLIKQRICSGPKVRKPHIKRIREDAGRDCACAYQTWKTAREGLLSKKNYILGSEKKQFRKSKLVF